MKIQSSSSLLSAITTRRFLLLDELEAFDLPLFFSFCLPLVEPDELVDDEDTELQPVDELEGPSPSLSLSLQDGARSVLCSGEESTPITFDWTITSFVSILSPLGLDDPDEDADEDASMSSVVPAFFWKNEPIPKRKYIIEII